MSNPEPSSERLRCASPCPVCGKPAASSHSPFCSQGCRDRDLLQWLGEGYRIPARPTGTDEDDGFDGGLDSGAVRPL